MITKFTNAFMLLIVVAGLSCSPADDTKGIYKVGREWHFKVAFFKDDMLVDSCSLKMATEKKGFLAMIMGQKSLNYRYQDCCSEPFYEKTGVSEKEWRFYSSAPFGLFCVHARFANAGCKLSTGHW